MYQLIQELSFENQPFHVFEYNGKVAFLALEIAKILEIGRLSQSLAQSKVVEQGVDYDVVPSSVLQVSHNLLPTYTQHPTILYDSGFFLFALRSNKPMAVPFTRWVIREAIPLAVQQKQQPKLDLSKAHWSSW